MSLCAEQSSQMLHLHEWRSATFSGCFCDARCRVCQTSCTSVPRELYRMTFSAFFLLRSGPRSVEGSPESPAPLSRKEATSPPPRVTSGSVGRSGHYRGNVRMNQTVQELLCVCVLCCPSHNSSSSRATMA